MVMIVLVLAIVAYLAVGALVRRAGAAARRRRLGPEMALITSVSLLRRGEPAAALELLGSTRGMDRTPPLTWAATAVTAAALAEVGRVADAAEHGARAAEQLPNPEAPRAEQLADYAALAAWSLCLTDDPGCWSPALTLARWAEARAPEVGFHVRALALAEIQAGWLDDGLVRSAQLLHEHELNDDERAAVLDVRAIGQARAGRYAVAVKTYRRARAFSAEGRLAAKAASALGDASSDDPS